MHRLNPKTCISVAIALAFLLAFLPKPLISWLSWFSTPVELAISPIQAPVRQAVVWLLGEPPAPIDELSVEELRLERDEWQLNWLKLRDENERLRQRIRELQQGSTTDIATDIRQLAAPVIGGGADLTTGLVKIRAGSRQGVNNSTVAVVDAVHLVGRVVDVDSRFCSILQLTARDAQSINGVVMLDDTTIGPKCLLTPTGRGTLTGPIGEAAPNQPADVEPGMRVRLIDRAWSSNARMLVIGRITDVQPSPQHPLHKVITVTPEFEIERVAEVVLRIAESQEETP